MPEGMNSEKWRWQNERKARSTAQSHGFGRKSRPVDIHRDVISVLILIWFRAVAVVSPCRCLEKTFARLARKLHDWRLPIGPSYCLSKQRIVIDQLWRCNPLDDGLVWMMEYSEWRDLSKPLWMAHLGLRTLDDPLRMTHFRLSTLDHSLWVIHFGSPSFDYPLRVSTSEDPIWTFHFGWSAFD